MGKVVEEVTRLYPVEVSDIFVPHSEEEISTFLKETKGKVSVGGGRYSMGGQTAIVGGVQIDMREMNQVISFSKEEETLHSNIKRNTLDTISPK